MKKNITIISIILLTIIGLTLIFGSLFIFDMKNEHMQIYSSNNYNNNNNNNLGDNKINRENYNSHNMNSINNEHNMNNLDNLDISNDNKNNNINNNNGNYNNIIPKEPGQGAFGAIVEIVNILNNDNNTDWSKVNINALREHLVDMNLLIMDTNVTETKIKNGMSFRIISKNNRTILAIQRMTTAHSDMILNKYWKNNYKKINNGIILNVTDPKDFIKIQNLGYYGIMAYGGNHHQRHHIQLAKGEIEIK